MPYTRPLVRIRYVKPSYVEERLERLKAGPESDVQGVGEPKQVLGKFAARANIRVNVPYVTQIAGIVGTTVSVGDSLGTIVGKYYVSQTSKTYTPQHPHPTGFSGKYLVQ